MAYRSLMLLCLLIPAFGITSPAWSFADPGEGLLACDKAQAGKVPVEGILREARLNAQLIAASEAGCLDLVVSYLDQGASLNARGPNGDTPLLAAVIKKRGETAAFLLEAGADPNKANELGLTPLSAAVYQGEVETVELLLRSGAVPLDPAAGLEADCKGPRNPIVFAARKGNSGLVRRLLDSGLDVNRRYYRGMTALMLVASHGREVPGDQGSRTASLLIDYGAEMELTNHLGRSALMIAAKRGNLDILTLLLERGADPLRVDIEGNSAFELAESELVHEELGRAVKRDTPFDDY